MDVLLLLARRLVKAASAPSWRVESNVVERCRAAGIRKEDISFARDTYTFNNPGAPSEFVDTFRRYYGPTMNAFDAAET